MAYTVCLIGCITSCIASGKGCLANNPADSRSLYAVKLAGHVALVFNAENIDQSLLPEVRDLPDMQYYKFGWGDYDYYQHPNPSVFQGTKAIFWPTSAALHLVGLPGSIEDSFPEAEMLELPLAKESFDKVQNFVTNSFVRVEQNKAEPIRDGYYSNSYFYQAKGTFYLFKTCNSWVAHALEAGGCSLAFPIVTSGTLFHQLNQLARQSAIKQESAASKAAAQTLE